MDRANYFDGQRVTKDDLNYTESSKTLAIQKTLAVLSARYPHLVTGSIPTDFVQTVLDESSSILVSSGVAGGINSTHLTPSQGSVTQINIQQGWAITEGMDIIDIPTSMVINKNDNTPNLRWVETSNGTMYVVAEYQETSASVGVDPSGNSFYTRYTPSYRLNITATYPSASNQVALAQFTGNSGAITNGTFQDIRTYFRPWTAAESTIIKTPAVAGITNMEQHQAATGHATPTVLNPHGMSLGDLGGIPPFVNGIYVMDNDAATYQSYSGSVGPPTQVNFTVPSHATGSVGNSVYTNSLIPLSTVTPTLMGDDTYYVVATPSGSMLYPKFIPISSIVDDPVQPQLNPTLLFLGKAAVVSSNIVSYEDKRTFYVQSPYLIRADPAEDTSDPGIGLQPYNTLVSNLNRLRYQVGVGLNGTGSTWTGPNPLTAGPTSNADTYHKHPQYSPITQFSNTSGSVHIDLSPFDNHVYHNTFGHTIFVSITVQMDITSADDWNKVEFMCDTNTLPTTSIAEVYLGIPGITSIRLTSTQTLTGYVPSGYYFRFKSTGYGSAVTVDRYGIIYY